MTSRYDKHTLSYFEENIIIFFQTHFPAESHISLKRDSKELRATRTCKSCICMICWPPKFPPFVNFKLAVENRTVVPQKSNVTPEQGKYELARVRFFGWLILRKLNTKDRKGGYRSKTPTTVERRRAKVSCFFSFSFWHLVGLSLPSSSRVPLFPTIKQEQNTPCLPTYPP